MLSYIVVHYIIWQPTSNFTETIAYDSRWHNVCCCSNLLLHRVLILLQCIKLNVRFL